MPLPAGSALLLHRWLVQVSAEGDQLRLLPYPERSSQTRPAEAISSFAPNNMWIK